jgi:hypothetical protein
MRSGFVLPRIFADSCAWPPNPLAPLTPQASLIMEEAFNNHDWDSDANWQRIRQGTFSSLAHPRRLALSRPQHIP